MSRNFKLLVGAVLLLIVAMVMGESQGDLVLAATRPRSTATANGSNATGVPSSGSNATSTSGSSSASTSSAGDTSGPSLTGAAGTGVPATGVSGGPGATSVGDPGNGQDVTSVSTAIVTVAPTLTPRPVQPSPTRWIRITIGTGSGGAPGATGVPGRR